MKLLQLILSSGLLIGLVLAVRTLFRKKLAPGVIYALWLIPLLRLLIPFTWEIPVAGTAEQMMNAPYELVSEWVGEKEENETVSISKDTVILEPGRNEETSVKKEEVPEKPIEATKQKRTWKIPKIHVEKLWIFLWVLGSISLGSLTVCQNRRLKKETASMKSAVSREGLTIRISEKISVPCLAGVFCPEILMPQTVFQDPQLYECALNHERAHYQKKDHLWTTLRILVCIVHWWNPLVWIAAKCAEEDAELACDARVLKDQTPEERRMYGYALLKILENAQEKKYRMCAATSLNGSKKSMKKRVTEIAKQTNTKKSVFVPILLVMLAALLLGCAVPTQKSRSETLEQETKQPEQIENGLQSEEKPQSDLEEAITNSILENYDPDTQDGLFRTESHVILANEGKATADGNEPEETTVFLLALRGKYQMYQGNLETIAEECLPISLTFAIDGAGNYILKEYWEPGDGSDYVKDVREKFPGETAEDALYAESYLPKLREESDQKAQAYFYQRGDLEECMEKLLVEISSGATLSTLEEVIAEHQESYEELRNYGAYTLRYCFEQFLQGGQTDVKGKLMETLCVEIMGDWGIAHHDVLYATGQDWFDAFLDHTLTLQETYPMEEIEKNYPAQWILLDLLNGMDQTSYVLENTSHKELTMQGLVQMVTAASWKQELLEKGISFWDLYVNVLENKEFHKESLTGIRTASLMYDSIPYELQIYYYPEDTAEQSGYAAGDLDEVLLRNKKTGDAVLLFCSDDRYVVNTDIEGFLLKKYELPQELLEGNSCAALKGKVTYSDYQMDLFLNFSGCLFEHSQYEEPLHGDSVPKSWYSLGGVGVCEKSDYESFATFEKGRLVSYDYIGNHMDSEFVEAFHTKEVSGCLYRYSMELFTAPETEALKKDTPLVGDYWVVFFTKGQGEPLYVKFFHCQYYTREEVFFW